MKNLSIDVHDSKVTTKPNTAEQPCIIYMVNKDEVVAVVWALSSLVNQKRPNFVLKKFLMGVQYRALRVAISGLFFKLSNSFESVSNMITITISTPVMVNSRGMKYLTIRTVHTCMRECTTFPTEVVVVGAMPRCRSVDDEPAVSVFAEDDIPWCTLEILEFWRRCIFGTGAMDLLLPWGPTSLPLASSN